MEKEQLLKEMHRSIVEGEDGLARELAAQWVTAGHDLTQAIEGGYVPGIEEVGGLYQTGEIFLPELVASAEAMKAAMGIIDTAMRQHGTVRQSCGKVVLGSMHHDIHDIGKSMVGSMLTANGFDVIDLGVDVSCEKFVEAVRVEKPDILGMSALLTTTMPEQKYVLELLTAENLRAKVRVIVGGAPVNNDWAKRIGADGYAANAITAVQIVKQLVR